MGNSANVGGGGIRVANSKFNIVNSTISGNKSIHSGGGISNYSGIVAFRNSTVTANVADDDMMGGGNGGGIYNFSGTVTFANTILSGNVDKSGENPDCEGSFLSDGYNLVGNDKGCGFAAASGDQMGAEMSPVNPKLAALADNGGLAQTHKPLADSPAIDAGNPAECTDEKSVLLISDQRGAVRPVDANQDGSKICDIGAYEAEGCGDGLLQAAAGETCDDGNMNNTDACPNTCKVAKCGDGAVQAGVEACDDGNAVDSDDCPNSCKSPTCGDGIVQKNEECEDKNQENSDSCLNSCMTAKCGDGIVQAGVESCDDGNKESGDGCEPDCQKTAPAGEMVPADSPGSDLPAGAPAEAGEQKSTTTSAGGCQLSR